MCLSLGIDLRSEATTKPKRKRQFPPSLQNCVMDTFLTKTSDAVVSNQGLNRDPAEDELRREVRLDFFIPVLDTVGLALKSRFNAECMTVVRYISCVMKRDDNFEAAVRQLSKLAQLDGDVCVTEGQLLFCNDVYRSLDSLQTFTQTMIASNHSIVYKNFFSLIKYLLTLPVTSASCERAHSKVDLVKCAVRASMSSERLEDLVILSSEKQILDHISLAAVVDRFAGFDRGLPL